MYIHTSNLVVTSLSTDDKWRITKLENKTQTKTNITKAETEKDTPKETKGADKNEKQEDEK